MSKCRPEAGMEFAVIEEFLRAVHVNGKTIELPQKIDQLHIHPRLTLTMAHTVTTPAFESLARGFDAQDAVAGVQQQLDRRMHMLDQRLSDILARLKP